MKKLPPLLFAQLLVSAGIGRAQPVITVPPQDKTVEVGATAFFTVTATGTPPLPLTGIRRRESDGNGTSSSAFSFAMRKALLSSLAGDQPFEQRALFGQKLALFLQQRGLLMM